MSEQAPDVPSARDMDDAEADAIREAALYFARARQKLDNAAISLGNRHGCEVEIDQDALEILSDGHLDRPSGVLQTDLDEIRERLDRAEHVEVLMELEEIDAEHSEEAA